MSKDWKETEKIVHLIERNINPNSEVLHNQFLPVLNSPSKRTRQCDIVITSVNGNRKTITLVEVQKRKSAVDVNTFNGWLKKTEEVGAQHLICVSMRKFPSSVIEIAREKRNTVYLININEISEIKLIPLQILKSKASYSNFNLTNLINLTVGLNKSLINRFNILEEDINNLKIDSNTKIFSFDKVNVYSIFEISRDYIKDKDYHVPELYKITFLETDNICILINGVFIKLKEFSFEFKWVHKLIEIQPNIISYEQIDNGTLAWLLEFNYDNEEKKINHKIPFIVKDNCLQVNLNELSTNPGIITTLELKSNG